MLSIFAAISCKKDPSSNVVNPNLLKAPYYFKGDVNGAAISFTVSVSCLLTPKDSPSFFLLESNWGSLTGQQIQILISGKLVGNIYAYPTFQITCNYVANPDPFAGSFYNGGWTADSTGFVNNFQVAITSIDTAAATIKGTFAGNLSGLDLATFQPGIKTFTNGMFFLPYKTQ